MDGEGGRTVGTPQADDGAFELPAVLARLDADDRDEQRAAVAAVRDTLADDPAVCLPTVPKLRRLLGDADVDFYGEVAYCLAELATESTADVAPSTDEIAAFAVENPERPATAELLRCLATIAADQPSAVVGDADAVAGVIDRRPGYDRRGLKIFQQLSAAQPGAIQSAVPVLTAALEDDPERHGVAVLSAVGRLARSETPLPTLEFVDPALELVDHDAVPLRRNAVGCLADVARRTPTAVEPAIPELATALEHDDGETRANAAVAIARVTAELTSVLEPVREPLLERLDDDHDRVRANAAVALGYGRVDAATDRLSTLAHEDPNPDVRERASWALDQVSSA
ncbi:HEAT repeat domain-containing protein [Haloterrigena salifodinae]|uniref:HEAT repeat domain-containing protein n=1 Tax=Haloterrigena salifodinae TaxID=2675099 RepID=UPI000F867A84|nr:HEAT repeat domain-containing protein [Haloterrigena salifodinae]